MFAFASAITDEATFAEQAQAGMRRLGEPVLPLERRGMRLQSAYNDMLDEARTRPDIEGVILLHQDCEIRDTAFLDKARAVLALPDVAVFGVIGATRVRSPLWMYGATAGRAIAIVRGVSSMMLPPDASDGPHAADAVDGMLLGFSPWAVANLRFDLRFEPSFHLYDVDVAFEARAAGKRVMIIGTDVVHNTDRPLVIADKSTWIEASTLFRRKWRLPPPPPPVYA